MKRKTNISVQSNTGTRRLAYMHVGEEYHGYASGDILDANTIVKLIHDALQGLSIDGSDIVTESITSEQIKDKSVTINDLSDEIVDQIQSKVETQYDEDTEELSITNINSNINI